MKERRSLGKGLEKKWRISILDEGKRHFGAPRTGKKEYKGA